MLATNKAYGTGTVMIIIYDAQSIDKLSDSDLEDLLSRFAEGNTGVIVGPVANSHLRRIAESSNIQFAGKSLTVDHACSLARKYSDRHDVVIVSDNPVALFSLSPRISVESPTELKRYRPETLKSEVGINPEAVLDLLYLAGSSASGIKPWAYITPSTAVAWLAKSGSLEAIMTDANSPALSSPLWVKMKTNAAETFGNYEEHKRALQRQSDLSIDTDAKMAPVNSHEAPGGEVLDSIIAIDSFLRSSPEEPLAISLKGSENLSVKRSASSILDQCSKVRSIELHSESRGKKVINLANFRDSVERVKEVLSARISERKGPIVTDNSKLVYGYFGSSDLDLMSDIDDVFLLAYALDARNNFDSLCELNKSLGCAGEDSAPLIETYRRLSLIAHADGNEHNTKGYIERDRPLAKILAKMEVKGLPVDSRRMARNESELRTKASKIKKSIEAKVGKRISLDSDKEVRALLFEDMGIVPAKRTATNMASVSEDALKALAKDHPIVRQVLEYRELHYVINKAFEPVRKLVKLETQSLHANFEQAKTTTGRLTCSNPNLQALPASSKYSNSLRECLTAPKGKVIVRADYSQAEIHVLASLAGCSKLQNALRSGGDIHRTTAAEVFGKDPTKVTDSERRAAKAINFGLMYGITEYGLANQLGVTPREAKGFISSYFERFPVIEGYLECLKEHAIEQGFVKTGTGRKIYFGNIPDDTKKRKEVLRQVTNAPMQGTVADLVKEAMVKLHNELQCHDELQNEYICLQVHDEIMVLTDEGNVDTVCELIRNAMGTKMINVMPNIDIEVDRSLVKRSHDSLEVPITA